MRHEVRTLLCDIRLAAIAIQSFADGKTRDEYSADAMCRSAIERQFIIIGEALTVLDKLESSLAQRIGRYQDIIGFRNLLVHGYSKIRNDVVWDAIRNDIPILIEQVSELIAATDAP